MIIDQYGQERQALFRENGPMYKFGDYMIGMYYTEEQKEHHLRMKELRKALSDTDYMAIKYAEDELSDEDYAVMKAQRQAWREEIRAIEKVFHEPTLTEEAAKEIIRKYEESQQ